MKYRLVFLSFGLASLGLFLVNQLFAIPLTPAGTGAEIGVILICGVTNTTQYTLYNDMEQTATLTNAYYQADGTNVGTAADTIPAASNNTYTVDDHVPSGFSGDAIITSDTPLTASIDTGPGTFLTAEFTADPLNSSSAPQVVTFTNLSQGYDTVLWDFGDGITSTVPSPTHTYAATGIYTATLTTDKVGCLDALPETNPADSVVITIASTTADVTVSQTAAPDPVITGAPLNYTLTITNNGPGTASDVAITDILPTGSTFLAASPGCTPAGSQVNCEISLLGSGMSVPLTLTVSAPEAVGSAINTVTVMAANDDPNMANNTAVLTTTVEHPAIYLPVVINP